MTNRDKNKFRGLEFLKPMNPLEVIRFFNSFHSCRRCAYDWIFGTISAEIESGKDEEIFNAICDTKKLEILDYHECERSGTVKIKVKALSYDTIMENLNYD